MNSVRGAAVGSRVGPLVDYRRVFGENPSRNEKPRTPLGRLGASWLRYALESHRQPEPEPAVTLRPEAHAQPVERDFLPTVGFTGRSDDSTDARAENTERRASN